MYDVAVSGAGPAGSYVAYLCAKRGLSTVLFERDKMPRPKCCAGGVLERAARLLDFSIPSSLVEKEIRGAVVVYGDSRNVIRSPDRLAVTCRRENLDHFLARKAADAGADFLDATAVRQAKEEGDRVTISSTSGQFEAKSLVVAEGVSSRTAKELFGEYVRPSFAAGMSRYCGFAGEMSDQMEFHFYPMDKSSFGIKNLAYGYGWLFPYASGANIGVGGKGWQRSSIESKMKAIEADAADRFGGLTSSEQVRSHVIPLSPRRRLRTRRCLAVGDAGGLANPITGEGMTYAFQSSGFAAEALDDFLVKRDEGALRRYEERCRKTILRDIRAASIIQESIRTVLGSLDKELFFDNLFASEELMQTSLGIVKGEEDWLSLLRLALPRLPALYFRSL